MDERTVLIVEDCQEEREILCRYLAFVGGRVLEATNGEEALRMVEENLPDLILLDLSMPVLDGWRTIERLQQDPTTAEVPVIALTAFHLDGEELEKAGFCGYLEKPVSPHHVLEEVERCIGRLDVSLAEPPPEDSSPLLEGSLPLSEGAAPLPEEPLPRAPIPPSPRELSKGQGHRLHRPRGRMQRSGSATGS